MTEKLLAADQRFSLFLGQFYQLWSGVEMLSSLAVGILLNIPDEETHLLTARMEFSRKAGLIRELLQRRTNPKKSEIKSALNKLQNESKRNVFAHSIILSSEHSVTFLERGWQQDYISSKHKFTLVEFTEHVHVFSKAVTDLMEALDISRDRLGTFSEAAMSAQSKPRKSPKPPKDKA